MSPYPVAKYNLASVSDEVKMVLAHSAVACTSMMLCLARLDSALLLCDRYTIVYDHSGYSRF